MNRGKLLEMFRTKAEEVAERDLRDVTEDADIAAMGVDSLSMLEVIGEMERQLEVRIPDDDLVGIQTVRQLLDLVEQRVQAQG